MPCYEAPPPWAGDEQRSAEEAVRLLCAAVQNDRLANLSDRLLRWWLGHRRIDLLIAQDVRSHASTRSQYLIELDIRAAEAELARRTTTEARGDGRG